MKHKIIKKKKKMRSDFVKNGVKFLTHPNVQSTPLSERVSFLEEKGLTSEEIEESINQSEKIVNLPTKDTSSASNQINSRVPVGNNEIAVPNSSTHFWWNVCSVLGFGAIVGLFYKTASKNSSTSAPIDQYNHEIPNNDAMPPMDGHHSQNFDNFIGNGVSNVQDGQELYEYPQCPAQKSVHSELAEITSAITKQTDEISTLISVFKEKEKLEAKKSSATKEHSDQSIAELRAEISNLKSMLLSKSRDETSIKNVGKDESILESTKPIEAEVTCTNLSREKEHPNYAERYAQMIESLKGLVKENSAAQLRQSAGIFIMYVKNLVEHPDVPRYRRISVGNSNYKQKIDTLVGAEKFLESIGFKKAGWNLEWSWSTEDPDILSNYLLILKSSLKAFEVVLNQKSNDKVLEFDEIEAAASTIFMSKENSNGLDKLSNAGPDEIVSNTSGVKVQDVSNDSVTINGRPTLKNHAEDMDSFFSRLNSNISVTDTSNSNSANPPSTISTVNGKNTEENIENPPHPESSADVPSSATEEVENKINQSTESDESGLPSYPKSFSDVMRMVENGDEVPGIKQIEDKVSIDSENPTKSVLTSTTKPWERKVKD